MDPAKSADLVLLHLADEVQQIISELQVSEANVLFSIQCDPLTVLAASQRDQ